MIGYATHGASARAATHVGRPLGAAAWTKVGAKVGAAMVAGLLGLSAEAQASGFQLREQSSEGLGNAFAGATAKAYDPSTVFSNPAGMTRLEGVWAESGAAYVMPQAAFQGAGTTAYGAPTGGGLGGDAGVDTLLPSFYGVASLGPDWRIGLAVNVPFGMSTDYDAGWVGRYQAMESHLQAMTFQPTIAYRLTDRLSVGAGPVLQYSSVGLSTAVDNMGLLPYDGLQKLTGEDLGVGFNLGALWEITDRTRVGVNYRSRIHHTFDGKTKYTNVHPGLSAAAGLVDSDATADLTTPDVASIGLYHEFDDQWAVAADLSWTHWSLFDRLSVDMAEGADTTTIENWHDTVFAAVGGIYRPNENWTVRLGLAYDMSPIPDKHRTARIPGADRYWVAAGVSYAVDD